MESLYNNDNAWYVSVLIDRKRTTKSLKTKDIIFIYKLEFITHNTIITEFM